MVTLWACVVSGQMRTNSKQIVLEFQWLKQHSSPLVPRVCCKVVWGCEPLQDLRSRDPHLGMGNGVSPLIIWTEWLWRSVRPVSHLHSFISTILLPGLRLSLKDAPHLLKGQIPWVTLRKKDYSWQPAQSSWNLSQTVIHSSDLFISPENHNSSKFTSKSIAFPSLFPLPSSLRRC